VFRRIFYNVTKEILQSEEYLNPKLCQAAVDELAKIEELRGP